MRSATLGATVFAVVMLLLFSPTAAVAKEADTAPTFAKDIAPIFQKNCQQCHRPGSIGPMSLTTYQEVRPWVRSIKNRVVLGEMPPYRYDRHVGIQELKDDLRLSESEIEMIARWVDDGAPLGDLADLPPPLSFPDLSEWAYADEFGPPDLVIKTKPYTLPAEGSDVWWRPIVPSGLTEDRCLKAVSVKPAEQGRGVAHHANSQLLDFDEESQEWVQVERLSEYALGKTGEVVPEDACRLLPANSMVSWDVHYYPNGEPVENDVIEMHEERGGAFARAPVRHFDLEHRLRVGFHIIPNPERPEHPCRGQRQRIGSPVKRRIFPRGSGQPVDQRDPQPDLRQSQGKCRAIQPTTDDCDE